MNADRVVFSIAATALLAIVGWTLLTRVHPPEATTPAGSAVHPEVPRRSMFSYTEVGTFLTGAMAAEAMADPLQRCLSYPDPPASHWSHAAVDAYCRYRTQPFLDGAQAKQLIGEGHADELDRRLAEALAKQVSDPNSRGLLDHIYQNDFEDGSPEWRTILDSWKRQSPRSAFAYAASGSAYVEAAGEARGGKWANETPRSNMEAMDRLLELARADLDKAATLDPRVSPIYPQMVIAARMDDDDDYADDAVAAANKANASGYALLAQLMVSAQPKWGGSIDAMRDVAARAQAGAKDNPLLELVLDEPDAYTAGICGCGGEKPGTRTAYPAVLDRIAAAATLSAAGNNASDHAQDEFALVYLSESLRFKPGFGDDRMLRLEAIGKVRGLRGMKDTVDRAVAAEADRIVASAPTDSNILGQLGQAYVEIGQWDKAWSLSERLIQAHPAEANSWILRAMIQKDQPRPGLRDTEAYIVAHFGNDPDATPAVEQARADLATTSPAP